MPSATPYGASWLAVLLLCVTLGTPLYAHAQARPIVYCADASPEGFDPALWDSSSTSNVVRQIFQGLLAFKPGGTTLAPALASSWTVSSDATTFTFDLRHGVSFHTTPYFHPTREFSADDVEFTFKRLTDKTTPFNRSFPASFIYPENVGFAGMIAKFEKLGPYRVRFTLKQPNVTFLSYFAMTFASIHSQEYASQLLENGKTHRINNYPIGTGPYKFRSYRKDDVLRLDANDAYWGEKQRTRNLIFVIAREASVRTQKMLTQECQVAAPVRDIDVPVLQRDPRLVLRSVQALNISYLAFNLKHVPLNLRDVRVALDVAIDRKAIFRTLFPRGDATEAVSAFPPAIPGYDFELQNDYDPELAKRLLREAGYPSGFDLDLWALPIARPTNPNGQLLAQLIQQDWARIGVRTRIKTYEWGEYLRRVGHGEHDVYMSGWQGDTGDADDFLAPTLTCGASAGGTRFCNAEFDRLIADARMTTDENKRLAKYKEAQLIFKHERPWITIAHSTIYVPTVKDLHGFMLSPNGNINFENVWR